MKLVFCPNCGDIFNLSKVTKTCSCGNSGGFYEKDGYHAVIFGSAIAMGITNSSFKNAVIAWRKFSVRTTLPAKDHEALLLDAFLINEPSFTIRRES